MLAADTTQTLAIRPRDPVMLERAVGARITVLEGDVWITQYGDSRDIILKPGQSFQVELPACLVMTGVGDARVVIQPPDLAPRGARPPSTWRRWLPLRWGAPAHLLMGVGVRRVSLG